ncbi:MAG: prepilin-type N-terminal cleavage/methylation domain-containing protein [Phycisphaerae bacterium]|nr:prepilin-type N-terminal cleavage/methylation domain-containing protein [Phycisphaerae bacterium]
MKRLFDSRSTGASIAAGFTLIELLVVIAVIAVLIGVLLPALGQARAAGRQVVCAANQRTIYAAIFQYATDSKEYHHAKRLNYGARFLRISTAGAYEPSNLRMVRPYIPNFTSDGGPDDVAYWGVIYDPYFNISVDPAWYTARMPWTSMDNPPFPGWKTWRCPAAKLMDPYPTNTQWEPDHLYQCYGFNGVDDRVDPSTRRPVMSWWKRQYVPAYGRVISTPTKVIDILQPSSLIMFQDAFEHMLDANGDTLNDLTQYNPDVDAGDARFKDWQREYFRHNGGCNTAWGDGHIRAIPKAEYNESLPWYTGITNR